MSVFLGVDTGGTYTDAVLLANGETVIAAAKSLTTREDLALGIGRAVDEVMRESGVKPAGISLASLSTTLATNALVEGQGGRVALIAIGFSQNDLGRQGLEASMKGDPVLTIAGGHGHAGQEKAPLDMVALEKGIAHIAPHVSGFAVAAQFATRNPAHEIAARDLIRRRTGKPVSCSHELSARLNGPKRAMTAVLNARLIVLIDHLITAAERLLSEKGITAPLMVVRGDGALVSAALARFKPIETILSGPAASLVGAHWLTGVPDALVSDIGGTTTDIAVLRQGRPAIDPLGARVGPFRTMVEAVAVRTFGLGGDSEVRLAHDGLAGSLELGPRRMMPLALCAKSWPEIVLPALARQVNGDRIAEMDGVFAIPMRAHGLDTEGLNPRELDLLDRIDGQVREVSRIVPNQRALAAMNGLIARGFVLLSGPTPTDAAHVLGRQAGWDGDAALAGLRLFSRKRTAAGKRLAASAQALAAMIIARLETQTVQAQLTTAFAEDDNEWGPHDPETLARHVLTTGGLDHRRGLIALDTKLNVPLVGLGASASTYYPAVGKRLGAETILPEHAGVANAIGAVVGQVSARVRGVVTSPSEGRFCAHLLTGPKDFAEEAAALACLEDELVTRAREQAKNSGADEIGVRVEKDIRRSEVQGRPVFIEAELTVEAAGRPRIATH